MQEEITVISAKAVRGGVIAVKTDIDEYLYSELLPFLPRADKRRAGIEYRIFYISPAAEEKYGVKPGNKMEYDDLLRLVEDSNFIRAKGKALTLLTGRDYSSAGLVKKLCEFYPKQSAQRACDEMLRLGLIKDEDYARRIAEELISRKGMSRKMAAAYMKNKGIDDDLALRALDETEYDPAQSIKKIILSKYRRQLSDETGFRRLYAALARRGFAYEDIRAAIEDLTQNG